ncbi:MAG TPA: S-layer homology domain-containing protein [Firmicutes bacterium]|nr:S-layer homology domain-containing protein [Bacillota bacterium]
MKQRLPATLLSLLLAFTLVLAMGTAVTAEETWTEVNSADALATALQEGGNIKLTGNIDISERQSWTVGSGVNVVLDLNNFTISSSCAVSNNYIIVVNGGSLTITDNSTEKGGKIEATDKSYGYGIQLRGNGSSFTLLAGTIQTTQETVDIYDSASSCSIDISGGKLVSTADNVLGVRGSETTVDITGGEMESAGRTGVYISNYGEPDSIIFNMTGGTLTHTGGRSGAIQMYKGATLTVGGTAEIKSTSSYAVQVQEDTILNVEGGALISESYCAVSCGETSTVNISGGEISALGRQSTTSGAIAAEDNADVTITGGSVSGTGNAVYAEDNSTVSISGEETSITTSATGSNYQSVKSTSSGNIIVTGGTFTKGGNSDDSVGAYIPEDSNLTQNENGEVLPTEKAVAQVDGGKAYTSLDDAIKAAANGETITLLKNIELEKYIISGTNTVIDLAGYTITAPDDSYIIVVAGGCSFTLNDSSEEGTGALTGGTGDNSHAGAVTVQNGGSFTMNGGNIIGNTGTTSAAGVSLGSNSSFTMTGGSITDNTSTGNIQAGVYANRASTVTISGNVNITGNVGNGSGTEVDSDLWLDTLSGATLKIGEDGLAEDARIGVYVNGGVDDVKNFTDTYESGKATTENFISNRTKYYVIEVETEDGVAAAMTLYKSAAPTASLAPGSYVGTQTVALSTTTSPSLTKIYYTTDGSDPKTSETTQTYTEPLTIDKTMTVKAYTSGLQGEYLASDVAEFAYTITASHEDNCPSADYTDVDTGAWYHEAIDFAIENDLMNGVGDNIFNPDGNLSRAMMVRILWNMEDQPTNVSGSYSDVVAGAWYEKAVLWATANNIVNGYPDGSFGPDNSITRQEMAAILYRYAQFKEYDMTAEDDLTRFPDGDETAEWAETFVRWAVAEGLLNGRDDGTLDPAGTATRAEVAQIFMNYCEKIAK